jgi:hypothetical protein
MMLQIKYYLSRKLLALLTTALLIYFIPLATDAQELTAENSKPCKTIVIGFVGGMRNPEDLTQGVAQIGKRLSDLNYPDLQVKIYRHWYWRRAYREIYQNIDRDRNESLSKEEILLAPKIVIYGHSLGGWAVIKLSRKLEQKGIPVELTAQIDSVGIGDEVVPSNVKAAVNYYQRTARFLRGEKTIRAENEKTKVLGNFLIKAVDHESLARQVEVSDVITEKVRALCVSATVASNVTHAAERGLRISNGLR